jgi:uncharacterized delta-60 repeat protein
MKKIAILIFFITYNINFAQGGALDNTFNSGTGANATVWSSAIQSDGKIILGGDFTSCNGSVSNRIVRLNADGTKDNTFNVVAGTNRSIKAIALQSDGKILIGGDFTSYNGTVINRIARLNSNGTLDTTFNVGTGCDAFVASIVIQPDNKIIVGGSFGNYNGKFVSRLVRLNTNGSIDNTFQNGLVQSGAVFSIALQQDGKIIITGGFDRYGTAKTDNIARLQTNGSLDTSFITISPIRFRLKFEGGFTRSLAIQQDGKIIVAGYFGEVDGQKAAGICRLNTNGTRDNSFNSALTGSLNGGQDTLTEFVTVQADGKILLGGTFSRYNNLPQNRLVRLNSNGTTDTSFNIGNGFVQDALDGAVYTISQSNDKIIVGGRFVSYNNVSKNNVVRLKANAVANRESNVLSNDSQISTVKVFPNPSNGNITMSFESTNENVELSLFDLSGNKVISKKYQTAKGINTIKEDVSRLKNGNYILQFNDGKNVTSQNVIIQNK